MAVRFLHQHNSVDLLLASHRESVYTSHSIFKRPVAKAVYLPTLPANITDLPTPAAAILARLPGVAKVDVAVSPAKPSARIIHFWDWHYVPMPDFAADLVDLKGRDIPAKELQLRYKAFLLEVELVQIEQAAALRALALHHGLREAWVEGVTPTNKKTFDEVVHGLAAAERDRKRLAELGQPEEVTDEDKLLRLQFGAVGRLIIDGVNIAALPLDVDGILKASKPKAGNMDFRRRHDYFVKTISEHDKVNVIVLGGGHDLSDCVRRLAPGCEYIRVRVVSYRK